MKKNISYVPLLLILLISTFSIKAQEELTPEDFLPLETNISIDEKAPVETVYIGFSIIGYDNADCTYEIVFSNFSPCPFEIRGNKLFANRILRTFNPLCDTPWRGDIKVTTNDGKSLIKRYYVKINNLPDPPMIVNFRSLNVDEDTKIGTDIAPYFWVWSDCHDPAKLSMLDNEYFEIIDDKIYTKSKLDFEENSFFELPLTVKAEESGLSTSYNLYVAINDVNESPTAISFSKATIAENSVIGTEVGTLTSSDEDANQTFTYTITENENFGITGDKLVSKLGFDFETLDSYSVEVTVKDQDGLSHTQAFTVAIEDINEAPTAIQLSNSTIAENSEVGSEVGTLTASDEDADQTFTYTIAENENFELVGDKLVSKSVFDFETLDHYSVELTVADQDGLSHTQSFTISVSDVNEEPTAIQLSANSIAENSAIGTEVGTLIASDVDANQTFIYTIAENENFEIVEDKLISKSAFDFETLDNYSVVITVADQDGLSFKESFSIQITDANEAPNAIQLSNSSIVENAAVGTEVGLLTASDVDASQTFIYTIAENEFFDIAGNQILVKGDLNYEKAASHELEISVNDQGGLTYKQRFTIEIVDENDAPSAILLSNTSITENSAIVTEIGQLSATDEDANQVLTYSVADNYNFIIINDRLFTKAVFDYESEDSYSVEITVNDQDGLSFTKSFTIQVENLNEAPVFASEPITVIAEDVEYVYTVECMDIDGDALRVLAIEKPDWLSLLDNGDGTCTLSGTPALAGLYHVVLEAKDAEFTTQQEFDIEVEVVTGIEPDFTEIKVNVYPNPVVNDLHIDLSNFKGQDLSIALYSLTGSLIFKETHKNLGEDVRIGKSLQNLKSGMYLLVLDMDGFRKTYKIVRE